MFDHDVTAARLAELPLARRCLGKHTNLVTALCDLHRVGLPEAEGVDGTCRPRAAGFAVAITHCLRRALDLDLNNPAEAAPRVSHGCPPSSCPVTVPRAALQLIKRYPSPANREKPSAGDAYAA